MRECEKWRRERSDRVEEEEGRVREREGRRDKGIIHECTNEVKYTFKYGYQRFA